MKVTTHHRSVLIKESAHTSSSIYGVVPLLKDRNNCYLCKVATNPFKFRREWVNVLTYGYGSHK